MFQFNGFQRSTRRIHFNTSLMGDRNASALDANDKKFNSRLVAPASLQFIEVFGAIPGQPLSDTFGARFLDDTIGYPMNSHEFTVSRATTARAR